MSLQSSFQDVFILIKNIMYVGTDCKREKETLLQLDQDRNFVETHHPSNDRHSFQRGS